MDYTPSARQRNAKRASREVNSFLQKSLDNKSITTRISTADNNQDPIIIYDGTEKILRTIPKASRLGGSGAKEFDEQSESLKQAIKGTYSRLKTKKHAKPVKESILPKLPIGTTTSIIAASSQPDLKNENRIVESKPAKKTVTFADLQEIKPPVKEDIDSDEEMLNSFRTQNIVQFDAETFSKLAKESTESSCKTRVKTPLRMHRPPQARSISPSRNYESTSDYESSDNDVSTVPTMTTDDLKVVLVGQHFATPVVHDAPLKPVKKSQNVAKQPSDKIEKVKSTTATSPKKPLAEKKPEPTSSIEQPSTTEPSNPNSEQILPDENEVETSNLETNIKDASEVEEISKRLQTYFTEKVKTLAQNNELGEEAEYWNEFVKQQELLDDGPNNGYRSDSSEESSKRRKKRDQQRHLFRNRIRNEIIKEYMKKRGLQNQDNTFAIWMAKEQDDPENPYVPEQTIHLKHYAHHDGVSKRNRSRSRSQSPSRTPGESKSTSHERQKQENGQHEDAMNVDESRYRLEENRESAEEDIEMLDNLHDTMIVRSIKAIARNRKRKNQQEENDAKKRSCQDTSVLEYLKKFQHMLKAKGIDLDMDRKLFEEAENLRTNQRTEKKFDNMDVDSHVAFENQSDDVGVVTMDEKPKLEIGGQSPPRRPAHLPPGSSTIGINWKVTANEVQLPYLLTRNVEKRMAALRETPQPRSQTVDNGDDDGISFDDFLKTMRNRITEREEELKAKAAVNSGQLSKPTVTLPFPTVDIIESKKKALMDGVVPEEVLRQYLRPKMDDNMNSNMPKLDPNMDIYATETESERGSESDRSTRRRRQRQRRQRTRSSGNKSDESDRGRTRRRQPETSGSEYSQPSSALSTEKSDSEASSKSRTLSKRAKRLKKKRGSSRAGSVLTPIQQEKEETESSTAKSVANDNATVSSQQQLPSSKPQTPSAGQAKDATVFTAPVNEKAKEEFVQPQQTQLQPPAQVPAIVHSQQQPNPQVNSLPQPQPQSQQVQTQSHSQQSFKTMTPLLLGQTFYDLIHSESMRKKVFKQEETLKYPTLYDALSAERGSVHEQFNSINAAIRIQEYPVPVHFRKRAIFFTLMNKPNEASVDFNTATKLDSTNHDTYWFRHQLYLKQNNPEAAIKDLDAITEINRNHIGAQWAKARIFQELGMNKQAITSYSQFIILKQECVEGYMQRSKIYEAEGDFYRASEDAKVVRILEPSNPYALLYEGVNRFKHGKYPEAIHVLNKLIKADPRNAEAFAYRGRAFAFVEKWEEALKDLNMAIRITPGKFDLYYYRGNLFRKRNPTRALQDLSVSILLNDSSANIEAYYSRALLYTTLNEAGLAVLDYQAVRELDPKRTEALMNMGLIYMRTNEFDKALDCFSGAIRSDPLNVRNYICRADLYQYMYRKPREENREEKEDEGKNQSGGKPGNADVLVRVGRKSATMDRFIKKVDELDRAVLDYSKAIHIAPTNHLLYLHRGKLLLRQGKMDEAALDFRAAFKLNSGIVQTFVQRVLILSFEQQYDQIVKEFEERRKFEIFTDSTIWMLIAKAKIKTGNIHGALDCLTEASVISPRDPQIYLQKGICYEGLGQFSAAEESFTRALYIRTNFAKAYYHRALCKIQQNDLRGLIDLNRAVKFETDYFDAFVSRAMFLYNQGYYTESIEDCNAAIRLEDTSIRPFLIRGCSYYRLRKYREAIDDFTKVARMDGRCLSAIYNRAVVYQVLGDYNNAIIHYSTVLLNEEDPNSYQNRGILYWLMGDIPNAYLDLVKATEAFSDDSHLKLLLAICLQSLNRADEAIAIYNSEITKNHYDLLLLLARANAYFASNKLALAKRDYERLIHYRPCFTEPWINLAYIAQMEDNYKQAWSLFSSAIQINPNCAAALEGRAVIHFLQRNTFAAQVDIQKALEIDPYNTSFRITYGVIAQSNHDEATAMQNYKAAIEIDPTNLLAYFNTANLYVRQKSYEKALQYYDYILKIQPRDAATLVNRAMVKTMMKDIQGALRDINSAIEEEPNAPYVYFNRANLYQKSGMYEEAEQDYTRVLEMSPGDGAAYLKRGETYSQQFRTVEAMKDFALYLASNQEGL